MILVANDFDFDCFTDDCFKMILIVLQLLAILSPHFFFFFAHFLRQSNVIETVNQANWW